VAAQKGFSTCMCMRTCYDFCVRHEAVTVSDASSDMIQLWHQWDVVACCVLDHFII